MQPGRGERQGRALSRAVWRGNCLPTGEPRAELCGPSVQGRCCSPRHTVSCMCFYFNGCQFGRTPCKTSPCPSYVLQFFLQFAFCHHLDIFCHLEISNFYEARSASFFMYAFWTLYVEKMCTYMTLFKEILPSFLLTFLMILIFVFTFLSHLGFNLM